MKVRIQLEVWTPKAIRHRKGVYRPKSDWIDGGLHVVLFKNRNCILVRQFGGEALYRRNGSPVAGFFDKEHAAARKFPTAIGVSRLDPDSLAKLYCRKY